MRETLHPDLRSSVRRLQGRTVLLHRLLTADPYQWRYAAIYNREYQGKLDRLTRLEAAGNWSEVVWLHERRYRPRALQDVAMAMSDPQYWRMVSRVWLDSDGADRSVWSQLWAATRPCREQAMTEREHRKLAQLPDKVMIYRGASRGLSWSLSRQAASATARCTTSPVLATAIIQRSQIQALFDRSKTHQADELVVLPIHCRRAGLSPLTPLRRAA